MATEPLLSVVMPTHNVGPWVRETLLSVLSQDLRDLEVIVVDDHSEDDTLDVVARVAAADPRVRVINASARGGGSARNEGVAHARGRFLIFCDGDDLVPDSAYSALVGSLRESGSDIAFGDYLKFRPGDTWRPTDSMRAFDAPARGVTLSSHPSLLYSRPCWNKAFRRDWWQRNGLEFPDVPRSNDIVPMVRAYLLATKVDIIPDVVYLYRERPGAGSMTARADSAESMLSYLAQESICARYVVETGNQELVRTYAKLIYDRDGYVHVARFLSRWSGGTDSDARVSAALRELLERIPAPPRGIPPVKRMPVQLVALGDISAARSLVTAVEGRLDSPRELLDAWREALVQIDAHSLRRAGDKDLLRAPITSSLTAKGGSRAPDSWDGAAGAVRRLFGQRELMLVPEGGAPREQLHDLLRVRDAVDGVVSEIANTGRQLILTGTIAQNEDEVSPALYDGEYEGNPPIPPSSVHWRELGDGRREWRAVFSATRLPLHRPLTPSLVLRGSQHAISVRVDAALPEYATMSPLLIDPVGDAVMVRRRRHWLPRAARRGLYIARDRARSLAADARRFAVWRDNR